MKENDLNDIYPIVISSHERSGTHLTIDLFRKQFKECKSRKMIGQGADRLYWAIDHLAHGGEFYRDWWGFLPDVKHSLVKTHLPIYDLLDGKIKEVESTYPGFSEYLRSRAILFHVYRDPRDVMASYHLYRKGWDPEARCPFGEFIRQKIEGLSRVKRWAVIISKSMSYSRVHPIRFEEILRDTRKVISNISQVCGIKPLMKSPLLPKKIKSRFHERLVRLHCCPESSAILGYTSEPKENWLRSLSRNDKEFFHEEAGEILIKLGYEQSNAWIDEDD